MNAVEFYANVGDRFGVIGPSRPNPHRGVDFPWSEGTFIPAWAPGTVVLNEWNGVLGWVLTIDAGDDLFAGFSHMRTQSPHKVGSTILFDEYIGEVGNTGSASRGAHLHATVSLVGADPGTAPVVDPLPHINTAIARNGDAPMRIITSKGREALVGEFTFQPLTDAAYQEERKLWGAAIPVSSTEWTRFKLRADERRPAPVELTAEQLAQIGASITVTIPELIIAGTARPSTLK